MLLKKQIEPRCTELLKHLRKKDIVHQIDDGTGITKYALCEKDVIVKLKLICICIFIAITVMKLFA